MQYCYIHHCTGDIYREYRARYDLAQYFTDSPDDQWLADHFFNTCLEVAKREDKAETQMLAEGLCNVGLCLQKNRRFACPIFYSLCRAVLFQSICSRSLNLVIKSIHDISIK